MVHRTLALTLVLAFSAPALAQKAGEEDAVTGLWKRADGSRIEELWSISRDNNVWKITASYRKDGKEIGAAHAEDIVFKDGLSFKRIYDKKPAADLRDGPGSFKIFKGDGFLMTSSGGGKIVRVLMKRIGDVVIAKVEPKPPEPEKKIDEPKKNPDPPMASVEERLTGVWTGMYPGTNYQVVISLKREEKFWNAEIYLTDAQGKLLGFTKNERGDFLPKDKNKLFVSELWKRQPPGPYLQPPNLHLSPNGPDLHMKVNSSVKPPEVDLKRGDAQVLARLAKAADPTAAVEAKVAAGKMEAGNIIQGMAIVRDGAKIVCGTGDGRILFGDLAAKKLEKTLPHPGMALQVCAVAPNEKWLVRGYIMALKSTEVELDLLNLETGEPMLTFDGPHAVYGGLAISRDSNLFAYPAKTEPNKPGMVRIFDTGNGKVKAFFRGTGDAMAFSPDNKFLTMADSKDGVGLQRFYWVNLLDLQGNVKAMLGGPHKTFVVGCAFAPDGKTLASIDADNLVALWILKSGAAYKVADFKSDKKAGHRTGSLAYSPDGKLLVIGDQYGNIHFCNPTTLAKIKSEAVQREDIRCLTLSARWAAATTSGSGPINLTEAPPPP